LKNDRLIRVIGTIDEVAYKTFSEELRALELASSLPITIELSSAGGVAYDALAFSGRMRNSPCDLVVKAYGYIASAAVLVLASGDKRYLAKEAWVMVHEDSGKIKGDVVTMEREVKHYRRMENQWATLLASLTDISADVWADLHKNTTYLCAGECLKLGLVDKLI
jgi:ATP-dependent Clp protease, protease subunit